MANVVTRHKRKKTRMKIHGSDLAFDIINYTLLVLSFIITLYPILFVLSASISDPDAVSSGKMFLFPINPSLEGYKYVFMQKDIWVGYANTIFYTVLGTLINLAVTVPCAYALSRKNLAGRKYIMLLFIFTMYFNGGLIPSYLNANSLHLVDTRTIMLISGAVSVFNLIVARTFFENTIPEQLNEAAEIDGCGDFKTFTKIILPLSKPILVVLMLYYGVGHWNSYFNAMIYLKDHAKFPLQLILREILILSSFSSDIMTDSMSPEAMAALLEQQDTANMLKYSVIVVSTLPMMIIYPRLQKYFAKGVMIGSVKG
ncbi:sugar ABC transporter permease [Vallitalea longa]|uniref:Sugar ABC transporter permease n=1 Tax=Vallitalea longa TaxID=2936439 RepID=A0A9W5YHR4_9FIRM|nr:carbohydrate ABC transporter permease [Vallitalea longa]GKX31453.1 sugar ABC transporter permease [Vallitalea longa]